MSVMSIKTVVTKLVEQEGSKAAIDSFLWLSHFLSFICLIFLLYFFKEMTVVLFNCQVLSKLLRCIINTMAVF